MNKINKVNIILSLIIAIVICISWYRSEHIIASADEGIPFFNLSRTYNLYSSAFYDTGLGLTGAYNTPRITLYGLMSFAEKLGIQNSKIQIILYFILILNALISVQYLSRAILKHQGDLVSLISSIFYLANLFALSQVWTRYISSIIFTWSYLPLFLVIFTNFLESGKKRYLLFLVISTTLFSQMYVIVSPILVLWSTGFLIWSSKLYKNSNKIKIVLLGAIFFVVWFIASLWWIVPFVSLKKTGLSSNLNIDNNLIAIRDVSKFFPSSEVILLRQKYMFGENSPYFNFYSEASLRKLSVIVFILMSVGLISSITAKKNIAIVLMLLVGWFVSKGVNIPFGDTFFSKLFSINYLFQTLRNPYEKFGLVFLLPYSFFFAIGVVYLSSKFKNVKFLMVGTILLLVCGYLAKPIWTGQVFNSEVYINVPDSYNEINKLINKSTQNTDSRLLQLPLLRGSNIKYNWGYSGEEPSEFLFDKASVSRVFSNPVIDEIYYKLGDPNYFRINNNYSSILKLLNVEFVVVHKDINRSTYFQEDYSDTIKYVSKWKDVEYYIDTPDLTLFKVGNLTSRSRVRLSERLIYVDNLEGLFSLVTDNNFDLKKNTIVVKEQNKFVKNIDQKLEIPKHEIHILDRNRYRVQIIDSEHPFLVELANNYDPSWNITIDGQSIPAQYISSGYSNLWLIDKKGSYEIDIIYKL